MSVKARIHSQRAGEAVARPVGVKMLQSRPALGDEVSFEHHGVAETGCVEHIELPSRGGAIAKIVIVQSPEK